MVPWLWLIAFPCGEHKNLICIKIIFLQCVLVLIWSNICCQSKVSGISLSSTPWNLFLYCCTPFHTPVQIQVFKQVAFPHMWQKSMTHNGIILSLRGRTSFHEFWFCCGLLRSRLQNSAFLCILSLVKWGQRYLWYFSCLFWDVPF